MAGTLHLTYPPHDVVSGHCVMASNVLSAPHFQNEAAAFAYVEARLWPNGPVCHHCGETERIGRLQGKTTRPGLYKCYACRKPFTVRMGTIFESSHLPLHLWLQIIHLMCASKKGISTHQIQRMLRCSMKTAWFLGIASASRCERSATCSLRRWAALAAPSKPTRWRKLRQRHGGDSGQCDRHRIDGEATGFQTIAMGEARCHLRPVRC